MMPSLPLVSTWPYCQRRRGSESLVKPKCSVMRSTVGLTANASESWPSRSLRRYWTSVMQRRGLGAAVSTPRFSLSRRRFGLAPLAVLESTAPPKRWGLSRWTAGEQLRISNFPFPFFTAAKNYELRDFTTESQRAQKGYFQFSILHLLCVLRVFVVKIAHASFCLISRSQRS